MQRGVLSWHSVPSNPWAHVQVYVVKLRSLLQVAPFWQGDESHGVAGQFAAATHVSVEPSK